MWTFLWLVSRSNARSTLGKSRLVTRAIPFFNLDKEGVFYHVLVLTLNVHSLSLFCFQNQSALFLCLVSTRNTRSHFVWSPRTTGTLSPFFISKFKVCFPLFGLRHATRALPMFVRALSLYLVPSPDARYLLLGLYKQRTLSLPLFGLETSGVWSRHVTRSLFCFFHLAKCALFYPVFLPGQKIVVTAREMRRGWCRMNEVLSKGSLIVT